MLQRSRRASALGYGRARDPKCLWKPRIAQHPFSSQIARNKFARYSEYQIERKLVSRCSSTINSTTIYSIQLRYSNTSLLYLTSFIFQCVNKKQTHLYFTILIVLSFEKKDSKRNSIISNYNNLSYNNYSTTKLEFEGFDVFRDNNRLRNVNKNNFR